MTTLLPPSDADVSRMRERLFTAVPIARRRRRTLAVGLSALVLVAGVTTAGAVVTLASVDARNTSFDCYTSADLRSPHGTSTYAADGRDSTALNSTAERVAFAIQTCGAGYTAIATDGEPTAPIDVAHPTACELSDGRLAVFPNEKNHRVEDFCSSLALDPPAE